MIAPSARGLFGKMPAEGDFVRINATDPTALELIGWLQEGNDQLRRSGLDLAPVPVCFVFSSTLARNVLVGVLMPSRDHVGRAFPLAAFELLESAVAASHFPVLPLVFRGFLHQLSALLEAAPSLSTAELAGRLNQLNSPSAGEWGVAQEQRRLQLGNSASAFTGPLRNPANADALLYAIRTFVKACADQKAKAPVKAKVVLDCPIGAESALPWLELAARILNWKPQPPSFVWSEGPVARLLLSLGPLPPSTLSYLARPDPSVATFWPLTTSQEPAMAAARQALSPEKRRVLDDDQISIETLLSQLSN